MSATPASSLPAIKRGSTAPVLAVQLTETVWELVAGCWRQTTSVLDLTGCTVALRARNAAGDLVITDAAMTVEDAANGRVSRAWGDADLSTAGMLELEFWITDAGGRKRKVPDSGYVSLSVAPDLSS